MNPQECLHLIKELTEERHHPDTIFLRKCQRGWIAYEHSALLLSHYFTPIKLREALISSTKNVCAMWQGSVCIRRGSDTQEFQLSCNTPDRMIIRCPAALTEDQEHRIIKKYGIRMPTAD